MCISSVVWLVCIFAKLSALVLGEASVKVSALESNYSSTHTLSFEPTRKNQVANGVGMHPFVFSALLYAQVIAGG